MATNEVKYAHAGRIMSATWRGNEHTVLQHLREQRRLTGTKEGCAEGDCGACMILLGELESGGQVRYSSANACFMPLSALHGRLLLTVEEVGRPDALHPVQQALVQEHGSQCGFCTPGFVISLYELYIRNTVRPAVDAVCDQLSGNLCRCTGYAPILRAAQTMYEPGRVERDQRADRELLEKLSAETTDRLEHGEQIAWLPATVGDFAAIRARRPGAVVIAGSTDVGLWMTKQLRSLPEVIQLTHVQDLKKVSSTPEGLEIGAAASLAHAFSSLEREFPELKELWARFASPAIRNQATLGGNIANASPIGDSAPALLTLNARLRLRRGDARREVLLSSFFTAYQRTALAEGEFIESIIVPRRTEGLFLRAYKVSKRHDDDISAVCLCIALELNGAGNNTKIRRARIGVGGMAAVPRRALATEEALEGDLLTEATMVRAATVLEKEFTPISDHRASASYRIKVAGNLLVRAALEYAGDELVRVSRGFGAVT